VELLALLLAQFHAPTYIHRRPLGAEDADKNPMSDDSRPNFTARQGQYLAFIHAYTLVLGRPPAEADMQRFFQVSGPAVHQMVVALENAGLIRRQPGVPRSIQLMVHRNALPDLLPGYGQSVITSGQRY